MGIFDRLKNWRRARTETERTKDAPPFLGLITTGIEEHYGISDPSKFKNFQGYGWVYACIHKIASSLVSLPLKIYRRTGDGIELVEDEAVNYLLAAVNPVTGLAGLKYITIVDLLIDGDCYWYKNLTGNTRAPISEVWRLQPNLVKVLPGGDWITGYKMEKGGKKAKKFEPEEVTHFFAPGPRKDFVGLAPLEAAALPAETDKETAEANLTFAKKGFMPDWFMEIEGFPAQDIEKLRALQAEINRGFEGKRHHVHLLAPGSKVQPAARSLRDMEFEVLRKMNREEICGVFQVPPVMVGILDKATYSNYDQAAKTFWGDTMLFWATLIEQQLNEDFLPHFGEDLIALFDYSGVEALQENLTEKMAVAKGAVESRIWLPDEARQFMGRFPEPLPGGFGRIFWGSAVEVPLATVPEEGSGAKALPAVRLKAAGLPKVLSPAARQTGDLPEEGRS